MATGDATATATGSGSPFEDEVRRLSNRAAVSDLLNRYAKMFDDRNFAEALPTLITADADIELPPDKYQGTDSDSMAVYHAEAVSPFGPTQHIFTSHLIDLDGESAQFRANCHVTHTLPPFAADGSPDNLFVVGSILAGEAVLDTGRMADPESATRPDLAARGLQTTRGLITHAAHRR